MTPNYALQPTVGAVAVLANRPTAALAPPSAERERWADKRSEVSLSSRIVVTSETESGGPHDLRR